MNRARAERAVEESDLDQADALLMMMLLRRAHNDTLEIPDWRVPALPQLAAAARVGVSTARRRLAHLELHGWVKRAVGDGRGHKSTYTVLPGGAVPGPCDCPRKRRAPMTDAERARRYRQRRKGASPRDAQSPKGVTKTAPFQAEKGASPRDERVSTSPGGPSTGIAPRIPGTSGACGCT